MWRGAVDFFPLGVICRLLRVFRFQVSAGAGGLLGQALSVPCAKFHVKTSQVSPSNVCSLHSEPAAPGGPCANATSVIAVSRNKPVIYQRRTGGAIAHSRAPDVVLRQPTRAAVTSEKTRHDEALLGKCFQCFKEKRSQWVALRSISWIIGQQCHE